jgi:hypothetical protein
MIEDKKGLGKPPNPYLNWWWSLALRRTFLNNACGLARKCTGSCGLTMIRQHLMKPSDKTPLARL